MVCHHDDGLRVDAIGHHVTVVCDILDHLVEPRPLHLFVFEVTEWVDDKIEQDAALTQLLHEQLLTLHRGRICGGGGAGIMTLSRSVSVPADRP